MTVHSGDDVFVLRSGWHWELTDGPPDARIFATKQDAQAAFEDLLRDSMDSDEDIESLDDLEVYAPKQRYVTRRGAWAEIETVEVE